MLDSKAIFLLAGSASKPALFNPPKYVVEVLEGI